MRDRGPCSECGEPSAVLLTIGDGPTVYFCSDCHRNFCVVNVSESQAEAWQRILDESMSSEVKVSPKAPPEPSGGIDVKSD